MFNFSSNVQSTEVKNPTPKPGQQQHSASNALVFDCLCRLSGHVHAGCSGDRSATISALELRGAQLIIAQSTSLGAARVSLGKPTSIALVLSNT